MRELIQVLRRFVVPYKRYLGFFVLFSILSAVLSIFSFAAPIPILSILFNIGQERVTTLMPWPSPMNELPDVLGNNANYYVQTMIDHYGATTTLLFIGLFLTFTTFLKTGSYLLASVSMMSIRTGVVRDIRNQLYQKITSLSLGLFSEERRGDIIARTSGDVQEIENSIMASLDMLFKNPILVIVYFTTLLIISWELTLFTILFVPLFGWFMGLVGRKLKQNSVKVQNLWSNTMSQVEETLGGLRIVKAFSAEEKVNARFDKINSNYRNSILKVTIQQRLAHPMSEFLGTLIVVIVLWFGGTLVLNEQVLSGPTSIYYLVMLYSIINPLKELSEASYAIMKGLVSIERVDKILMAEVTIKELERPIHLNSSRHQVEFRRVSFRYAEQWMSRDINLVIPKGKTVALVGQSDSGKSTSVDSIPCYYDIQEGEVLIDDINVRDLGVRSLRHLVGNVNQEAILFNDTFFNNITFGVDHATQEMVDQAVHIASAYEFIMESEEGFDTNIGDRGSKLNGGQRQRISIARAIFKNPPILILDEATSALDIENERLVQDALERLMDTRATMAVTHCLSTIKHASEICVLHEGRIVERGTHEELIAREGYYKKLHDMREV